MSTKAFQVKILVKNKFEKYIYFTYIYVLSLFFKYCSVSKLLNR
jgi:hypothetical protein